LIKLNKMQVLKKKSLKIIKDLFKNKI